MVSFLNCSPLVSWRERCVGEGGKKTGFPAHGEGEAWSQMDSGTGRLINGAG